MSQPDSKPMTRADSQAKTGHLRFVLLPAQELWSSPSATIEVSLPDELVPGFLSHPSIVINLPISPWAEQPAARIHALDIARHLIDEKLLMQWMLLQVDGVPPPGDSAASDPAGAA